MMKNLSTKADFCWMHSHAWGDCLSRLSFCSLSRRQTLHYQFACLTSFRIKANKSQPKVALPKPVLHFVSRPLRGLTCWSVICFTNISKVKNGKGIGFCPSMDRHFGYQITLPWGTSSLDMLLGRKTLSIAGCLESLSSMMRSTT